MTHDILTAATALMAAIAAILGYKNHAAISTIKVEINSRMTELLDTTRRLASAEGKAAGQESERQRGQ